MSINAELIDKGRLTAREAEVARLMAEGHSDKVIARALAMSIRTLNTHSVHIYQKLGVHSASIASGSASINSRVFAVAEMVLRGMVSIKRGVDV